MKRYKLCSRTAGNHGAPNEIPIDDFIEQDFLSYQNDTLDDDRKNELLTIAIDQEHFEYWVEEIKNQ